MKLTEAQRSVVAEQGPMVVTGSFGCGLTTALGARADRLTRDVTLVLAHSRSGAARIGGMTVWDAATAVLAEHEGQVHILDRSAQQRAVAALLAGEGGQQWPTLHAELADPEFVDEVADMVPRLQASFLGDEELFTHAQAAGELDRWQELSAFTARYRAFLDAAGQTDWGGALVRASLCLRGADVAAAVRGRWRHVVVDGYEQASFATNRLIMQLAGGPDGSVTLGGNPSISMPSTIGSSARHLRSAARRLTHAAVVELPERLRARPLTTPEPDRTDAAFVSLSIEAAEDAIGQEWPSVAMSGIDRWPDGPRPHRWFDRHLLAGPDVPDDDTRLASHRVELVSRVGLVASRATQTLAVSPPTTLDPALGPLIANAVAVGTGHGSPHPDLTAHTSPTVPTVPTSPTPRSN